MKYEVRYREVREGWFDVEAENEIDAYNKFWDMVGTEEQQHKYDLDDVDTQFCFYTDEELMNTYQKTREEIRKLYPDIAYEMRRMMDKYDVDMEYARYEAIDYVLLRDRVVCV